MMGRVHTSGEIPAPKNPGDRYMQNGLSRAHGTLGGDCYRWHLAINRKQIKA